MRGCERRSTLSTVADTDQQSRTKRVWIGLLAVLAVIVAIALIQDAVTKHGPTQAEKLAASECHLLRTFSGSHVPQGVAVRAEADFNLVDLRNHARYGQLDHLGALLVQSTTDPEMGGTQANLQPVLAECDRLWPRSLQDA